MEAFIQGLSTGVISTAAIAGSSVLYALSRRHRCEECDKKTTKVCLIVEVSPPGGKHRPGKKYVMIVIFRECRVHHEHVSFTVKYVFMSRDVYDSKPAIEKNRATERIESLCKRAGFTLPPIVTVSPQPIPALLSVQTNFSKPVLVH